MLIEGRLAAEGSLDEVAAREDVVSAYLGKSFRVVGTCGGDNPTAADATEPLPRRLDAHHLAVDADDPHLDARRQIRALRGPDRVVEAHASVAADDRLVERRMVAQPRITALPRRQPEDSCA